MSKLNPQQQSAVTYIDSPLLVLAGAGSGKTRVITEKIGYLIRRCQIHPRNIFAVTFTNKAAREMRERLTKLLSAEQADEVTLSTFHSLGLSILRQHLALVGLKNGFVIYDENDCREVMSSLCKKMQINDKHIVADALQQISTWKNAGVIADKAYSVSTSIKQKQISTLYVAYEKHLRLYNATDFDDLICLPLQLLSQHRDVLEKWQNTIRYLLVDEYQDTNTSQYQLVKLLVGVRASFTVVGDDDQSIYAWRGAQVENLQLLASDFPKLKTVKLEQNYRSTNCILNSANALIAHNAHLFEKKLWSEFGFGEKIRVLMCDDDVAEAQQIAAEIKSQQLRSKCSYADFAILYRGNSQSRALEKALQEQQVPYHLSGGTSLFSRSEIKDVLAYIRLLINPTDNNAFLRSINVPRRGIGDTTVEKLIQYAQFREVPLLSACAELALAQQVTPVAYQKLQNFAQFIGKYSQRIHGEDPVAVIKQLIEAIGYESHLESTTADKKIIDFRMSNILDLLNWIDEWRAKSASLSDVINQLMLIDSINSDEKHEQVHLLTMHAAKGLEFPHVYVVGFEEELLPHRTSIEEENVDEERRLAYVAITRARNTLCLSVAKQRKINGAMRSSEPSRFLKELVQQDLQWIGQMHTAMQSPPQAKSHLASIREMLAQRG